MRPLVVDDPSPFPIVHGRYQMTNLVASKEVQTLLDRASGIGEAGGNARLKAIMRDLLESAMSLIEKHDISESEFWQAINYLQNGAPEFGLIVPGVGIEHFLDLHMDAKDAAAGLSGGTPRTIEGPLYVAGAPLVDSGATLTDDADAGEVLTMSGAVRRGCGALTVRPFRTPSSMSGMPIQRASTRILIRRVSRPHSTTAAAS